MDWLYVPGLADLNSGSSEQSQSIELSATSSEIHTLPECLPRGWKKRPYARLLSGTILNPLAALNGVESWIASLRASRVSLYQLQGDGSFCMMSVGFGLTWPESSEKLNRPAYFLRMYQGSFPWASNTLSATWLRWGTMQNGVVSPQSPLELPMREKGSLFFPTLIRRDARSFLGAPRSKNARGTEPLCVVLGGRPNPVWAEWMMGFPIGWTELNASATPSSQPKQNLRGEY